MGRGLFSTIDRCFTVGALRAQHWKVGGAGDIY